MSETGHNGEELGLASVFQPLYTPLGMFVFEFAKLETALTQSLNALMEIDYKEGLVFEWKMQNFSERIGKFGTLAAKRCKSEDTKVAAEEIFAALKQANEDRNNLIHGSWSGYSPSAQTFSKVRVTADKEGRLHDIPVNGVSLGMLADEIKYIKKVQYVLADWYFRFIRQDTCEPLPPPLSDRLPDNSPIGELIARNETARAHGLGEDSK